MCKRVFIFMIFVCDYACVQCRSQMQTVKEKMITQELLGDELTN